MSRADVSTKKEIKLDDLLATHLPAAVRACVGGLKATKIAWNQQTHRFEDTGVPDHKERRESARMIVEYVIGKPIERSMQVTGNYRDLDSLIQSLKQSLEAQRLIKGGFFDQLLVDEPAGNHADQNSAQSTAEGEESAREGAPNSEQKTG